jgi:hypothetical protein
MSSPVPQTVVIGTKSIWVTNEIKLPDLDPSVNLIGHAACSHNRNDQITIYNDYR